MFEAKVKALISECLKERADLFLLELSVSDTNAIKVVIDGDDGVSVEDCMLVSRAIEHNLDREEQDFSIEVTSAGATSPLVHKRQFAKNIGRILQVKTVENEQFEGVLTETSEDTMTLSWKTREPKPVGKGKVTVKKEKKLNYNEIQQAKVKLKF